MVNCNRNLTRRCAENKSFSTIIALDVSVSRYSNYSTNKQNLFKENFIVTSTMGTKFLSLKLFKTYFFEILLANRSPYVTKNQANFSHAWKPLSAGCVTCQEVEV